jgi:hypothetical protein
MMNSSLVSDIYVAIVFGFLVLFHVLSWQYMHIYIYIIEVLEVIKNLFKELKGFVI